MDLAKQTEKQYALMKEILGEKGVDLDAVKEDVKRFEVEVPSWVFGEFGGGRFGNYMPPGPAQTIQQKLEDAAFCHKLTGAASRVAIHTGWDVPGSVAFENISADMFAEVKEYAESQGVSLGAVNPTLFLTGTHLGSLSSPLDCVRDRLIEHCMVSCEIGEKYATGLVT